MKTLFAQWSQYENEKNHQFQRVVQLRFESEEKNEKMVQVRRQEADEWPVGQGTVVSGRAPNMRVLAILVFFMVAFVLYILFYVYKSGRLGRSCGVRACPDAFIFARSALLAGNDSNRASHAGVLKRVDVVT